ncbi:hypothetical protein HPB48_012761 [Haemaphysalis longicornis]|uniref:FP protein C-terminal domain-containing protein n=1 Tax=Haemaphysalis longicornis TaxID=44386 RepID=A0A9J6G9M5_HAELO|nr:hypothetical protein HPB48_012761 [Haemaphysalis longicornis]
MDVSRLVAVAASKHSHGIAKSSARVHHAIWADANRMSASQRKPPAISRLKNRRRLIGNCSPAEPDNRAKLRFLYRLGQKAEIKDITKKTHDFGTKVADQSARISFIENEVDRLEQYPRKYNVEIHGIKETDDEDLRGVLGSLANKLKLMVPRPEEFEAVHRVKARSNAVAPILVRFTRDKWLEQRTFLRNEKIFVNENLTACTKHLYWLTKNRAAANQYRFVCVRNGKIYAKKEEGMSLIRFKCEADLSKIGGIDD